MNISGIDELELLVLKEFIEGKIQVDKLELDRRGFYKIGRFQMKQIQNICKKVLAELETVTNQRNDLALKLSEKQDKLYKKDKIIDEMALFINGLNAGIGLNRVFEKLYCEFLRSDEDCCWKITKSCKDCVKEYFEKKVGEE